MNTEANTILIVDDDPMNLRALTDILEHEYTLYAELDSKNCVESAARLQPDLILLDVMMPDMNGFEVIQALKRTDNTKDIPIIFVTGLNNADDEIRGFSFGAVDYINKPFNSLVVKMRVQHQIKIVNLIREIQNLSVTDTLTGIGNRRYFNILLEQEWERAKRQQTPIGFMLLDIDDFTQINDKYGHLSGDSALKIVARVISQRVERSIDKFARWGGEEFAIILPDTTLSGAMKVAETVRDAVEHTDVEIGDANPCRITVSIGVHCIIPEQIGDYSIDRLISEADKALFTAKKNGKNQVCAAEDLSSNIETTKK